MASNRATRIRSELHPCVGHGLCCAAGCMDDGIPWAMIRRSADDVGARAQARASFDAFLLRFSTGARPLDYEDITNPAPVWHPCAYLRIIPARCHEVRERPAHTVLRLHEQHFRDGLLTALLRQYPRASNASHEFSGEALV
jgi:hypothetical protein